ncbi:MAG: metallophosphoesterase [Chitinophagales bacterium]
MARYAVSDIHGCLTTFKSLIEKIDLKKEDELYIIGDMIDRGPNGKGVMDLVMQMIEDGYHVTPIMGNHEWLFLQAIDETIPYCWDWRRYQNWIKNGGITTMMNFGYKRIDDLKNLDKKYDTFIRNLKPYVELDDYFLVHAGFNFKEEDIFKNTHDMFWARNWYDTIDNEKIKNKVIVHGHTTHSYEKLEEEIKEMKYPAINIDCGCVYDVKTNKGYLCALNLDNREIVLQKNVDREMVPAKN